jgi:CHAT domain-containing protein
MGDYEQAAAENRRALAIRERKQGIDHAETATILNNLAMLQLDLGRRDEAAVLLRRVLEIRRKTLGGEHKLTGYSLANLGFAEAAGQRHAEALRAFTEANVVAGKVIEQVFALAGEKDKLAYVRQQEWGYFAELSLIHRHFPRDPDALRLGLDLVLARKGIVFDAQARQNDTLAGNLDPEARALWDDLARHRAARARLTPSHGDSQEDRRQQFDDAIASLEQRLAGKSALAAAQIRQRRTTSAEVAERLPAGSILVEIVKIDDYDWATDKWVQRQRYLAFLLHPDRRIDLVDLGDANHLDRELRESLRQLDRIGLDNDLQLAAARRLHQLIWQPMAGSADAATVIFSPDGQLNLMPFAAMLSGNGKFFIEDHQVAYVTSGRELARATTGIEPDSQLYLAANPAFGFSAKAASAGGFLRFEPLPGTQEEADAIPGLLPGKQRIVTGREATETSVLGAGRPRVMHLATHGFFLSDQPRVAPGTRGAEALLELGPNKVTTLASVSQENPLLRSGLALAGANHAGQSQGADDGLLTALEVSGMSLHGTDLVTLSACETGRGDVKSGEGVFGLRRAFALSGARHLVMSLWPVGDEATAQQMRVFYRQYGSGARPAEALRTAQLASIEALRAQGKVAEPALWAPFIAQGW